MKIKELPEMEKPYEKLENYGATKLSDAELLAVIIKSGTKNKTSIELIYNTEYEFLNNISFNH